MPLYDVLNTETNEVSEIFLLISAREQYFKDNPHMTAVPCAPMLHSGRGLGGGLAVDSSFNDILLEIKKKNSGGYKAGISTINTK